MPHSSSSSSCSWVGQNAEALFQPEGLSAHRRNSQHCWRQTLPLRTTLVHTWLHWYMSGGFHVISLQSNMKCGVCICKELHAMSCCQVSRPCTNVILKRTTREQTTLDQNHGFSRSHPFVLHVHRPLLIAVVNSTPCQTAE